MPIVHAACDGNNGGLSVAKHEKRNRGGGGGNRMGAKEQEKEG